MRRLPKKKSKYEQSDYRRSIKSVKGPSSTDCDVVVVGAGPYGLSAGMYLKAKNVHVRVFGEPMDFWANKMPKGMLLRSPREASNIADPESAFTLEAYEAASGRKPAAPVPLETFVDYGRWFQQQLSSEIDRRSIYRISRENSSFKVALQDGRMVRSRRVVVAAGIRGFQRKPAVFGQLPALQVSHCYEGRKISELAGKRVAVIGAGQSALESAALIARCGFGRGSYRQDPGLRWIGESGSTAESQGWIGQTSAQLRDWPLEPNPAPPLNANSGFSNFTASDGSTPAGRATPAPAPTAKPTPPLPPASLRVVP